MILRRTPSVLVAALVALSLSACAAEPVEPEASPPPFASEEEAFAAAEETYRAYVDALNLSWSGERDSNPLRFLAGAALDNEVSSTDELAKAGKSISGRFAISSLKASSYDSAGGRVQLLACVDISESIIRDVDGIDVTPMERDLVVPLSVIVATSDSFSVITELNGYPEGLSC